MSSASQQGELVEKIECKEMKQVIRSQRNTGAIALALLLVVTAAMMNASGCSSKIPTRDELEQIHATYIDMGSKINQLTDFFEALRKMNMENAAFLQNAREAIDESEALSQELKGDLEALRSFEYQGELQQLGEDIEEYCVKVEEVLLELNELYQPIRTLLQAIEPALREEVALTSMEVPENDAATLERLSRLESALATTMNSLQQVQVPETLKNYKKLLEKMFEALGGAVDGLIRYARGEMAGVSLDSNPDLDRFNQLLELNAPLMLDIQDGLKVYHIDPCMQKVEDAMYGLFLKYGAEDEEENR